MATIQEWHLFKSGIWSIIYGIAGEELDLAALAYTNMWTELDHRSSQSRRLYKKMYTVKVENKYRG